MRLCSILAVAILVAWPSARANGQATVPAPPIGADCTGAAPRQEVRELTAEQWQRFIAAVRALQRRETPQTASAYDRLAFIHNKFANSGRIHQTASFLPWHRLFLRAYEHALQQIDPSVTVPYWDWTRDSQRLANAPFWSRALFGANGRGVDGVVRDGAFAGWIPFRGPFAGAGPRTIGLTRQWGNDLGLETAAAAPAIARVLRRAKTYSRLREGLEFGGHGDVHIAVGGDMADFFSPNDPVFYLHHAFIDKLWDDWQARPGNDALDYGGPTVRGPDRAKLSDVLDGFEAVTVADVMRSSSLCVSYERSTRALETVTTLRSSAATVRPSERVAYSATITSAQAGTVDFEQRFGGGAPSVPLCTGVKPVFAVNTWTARCEIGARRLQGWAPLKTVTATYRGGAGELASEGSVKQRVARGNPTVLWTPAATIPYGTPLGANLDAFESTPGRKRFTVLASPAPDEVPVTRGTVLDAGYQVLFLRFEPRRGPAQLLTRSIVVTPGTLAVLPRDQRITTLEPTPPLDFDIIGFVAGETPASLTGFEQPICRAARPEGSAEDAPRPEGTYAIFCEGGSSLNYVFDTTGTGTLEVVDPEDPTAGTEPDRRPPPVQAGPFRPRPVVCTIFRTKRVLCGGIKRRRSVARGLFVRDEKVAARGGARRRGQLLELRPGRPVRPGLYLLTLVSRGGGRREVFVRVVPEAVARRSSAPAVRFDRPRTRVCRLGTMRLLGTRRRDGIRVSRWRIVQRPR